MFWGADTAEVRALSARSRAAGERLGEIIEAIGAAAASVAWTGPDADAFRQAVRTSVDGQGWACVQDLADRAHELEAQADEQDSASEPDGASGESGQPRPEEHNKFWWWQDGYAPLWGGNADLQDDIPLDDPAFTLDNVNQEDIGDCMALALMATIARQDPHYMQQHITRLDKERYQVILYDGYGNPKTYIVTGDVLRGGVRGQDCNQNWMTIYEAALIQAGLLDSKGDYASGVYADDFVQAITGAKGTTRWTGGGYGQTMPTYESLVAQIQSGQPTSLGTPTTSVTDDYARQLGIQPLALVENHAYMVDCVNPDGTITIVNPWGDEKYPDPDKNGTHRMTITREQYELYFNAVYQAPTSDKWKR